jgi:hypothetical protein
LNGKRHGKAKYIVKSGKSRIGLCHEDKRVKWVRET